MLSCMKLCRLIILGLCVYIPSATAAEPVATMLQFSHEFGGAPTTRVGLRVFSTKVDDTPAPAAVLPLYSSHSGLPGWPPMRNADDQRSFCERSPSGCLAFGLLLGVGIAYFLIEAADDADGDSRVSFTSGSTTVTANRSR